MREGWQRYKSGQLVRTLEAGLDDGPFLRITCNNLDVRGHRVGGAILSERSRIKYDGRVCIEGQKRKIESQRALLKLLVRMLFQGFGASRQSSAPIIVPGHVMESTLNASWMLEKQHSSVRAQPRHANGSSRPLFLRKQPA